MNAPTPYLAQAAALMGEGRFEEGRALLMRHAQGKTHPHTYHVLAIASEVLGDTERAIYYAQRAATADPGDADLVLGLSQRLFVAGRLKESLEILEKWSAPRPTHPGVFAARIGLLSKLNRDEEAMRYVRNAPPPVRDHPLVAETFGAVLRKLGNTEEALDVFSRSGRLLSAATLVLDGGGVGEAAKKVAEICRAFPDDDVAWGRYVSVLNYSQDAGLEESLRAHKEYGRAVRHRVGPPMSSWNVTPDPDRKLRVGIISPDLRRHAIVSFLAPLLENYDRSRWHVTAYSTHAKQDEVSARLRTLVDAWRWLPIPHTPLLARRIREDKIDVAIELSGHTEEHKLDAMHLRPAPVQMTYLGYPNTTGLDTIDVRLVDSITDPPGAERWATERLVRIDPCFLCYKPIDGAPELVLPPCAASADAGVTFGSFNLPRKISPRTLAMWGRLLASVPESRLVLKHASLSQEWMLARLQSRLAEAGIDSSRTTILPPAPAYADHLGAYAGVDIALDTYPYHGTTTTCEALWMGVPVVTLLGDRHAARVGASLLSAVGLPELIANSEEGFVRIAAGLAADRARLRAWRTPGNDSLRSRMAASPLCDARTFSARFQRAVREAWQRWCAAQGKQGAAGCAR
jgi:protein O-GlcNAc transferase